MVGMRLDPLLTGEERAAHHEVFGQARAIRSDEWGVGTPSVFAQQRSHPPFPLVNLDEAVGQLQRNPADVPVLDWGIVFRPLLWPLLLGNAWSLGLRWFLRESLLFLSLFWLLSVLSARPGASDEESRWRTSIAAVAAIAVSFSSAFRWWMSTGLTDMVVYAGSAVAAVATGRRAPTRGRRLLWSLATFYAATCFFFVFYPPSWAPFIWVMAGAVIDLLSREGRTPARLAGALAPLVVVVALAGLIGIAYYSPYLALVSHTAYPGNRISLGGELSLDRLLDMMLPSHDVLTPIKGEAEYVGRAPWMNVCEASVVETIPFFLLLATAAVSAQVRAAFRAVARRNPGTVFACALLGAWMFLPLPRWFGTLTLMRWSPGIRTLFPFGIAVAILAASLLAELVANPPTRRLAWSEVAFGLLALATAFVGAHQHLLPSIPMTWHWLPMTVVAVTSMVGLLVLHDSRGAFVLAAGWALAVFLINVKVNPIIRTRDLFFKGSGYAAIERALAEKPGRIVDYQLHFGNTLVGHGVPSLASVQFAPDLGLYRFLTAGQGTPEDLYNRYANTMLAFPPAKTQLLNQDHFQVAVSPCSRRLAALQVNHFVVSAPTALPSDCSNSFETIRAGDVVLWSRKAAVCRFGVARGPRPPESAEEFDYSCRASREGQPRLEVGRLGFDLQAPAGSGIHYAMAINTSILGQVSCVNAEAEIVDTHLVVSPDGRGQVRCSVTYLDTLGGIRRLLETRKRPATAAR